MRSDEEESLIRGTPADGQESFRAAFRFDSRLNVVLLRDGWGHTPWTRVEQAAIQERCLNDGWERLIVVNLDGSSPPKWMPRVSIFLDLQTYPFEQAVGAIKRQVQQLGGDVKPQSPSDIARAKLSAVDFDRETERVFRTPEGVQLADDAVVRASEWLFAELRKLSDEGGRNWEVVSGRDHARYGVVRAHGCSALFNWERHFNDCNEGELTIRAMGASFETPEEGRAGKHFRHFGSDKIPTVERNYKVTRHPALGVAWLSGGKVVTSEDVAGEILNLMINLITRRG